MNPTNPLLPLDPVTAIFFPGNWPNDDVTASNKRIGPYPDATAANVGQGDTKTMRDNAEILP